ncbi:hypothetical protein HDU77_010907, partial [Chytriomyces hyalinus]
MKWNNNETAPTTKKHKKEGKSKKKNESLPPDVRTLWAKKATLSQAPRPEKRPEDYEPGDSDFRQ